jgi:hypothetical protein
LLYLASYEVTVLRKRLPIALFLFAIALTGCGRHDVMRVPQLDGYAYTGTPTSGTNSDYRCVNEPNVLPDYDWDLDGSGRYTVCPSTKAFSDILIHGSTSYGNEICVFPAQYIDDSHIYTKPTLSGTGPISACVQGTPNGAYASFQGVNYNAVFIVEKRDYQQMMECLIQRNYYFCPSFSFGTFR